MSGPEKPTAEHVRDYRYKNECGLQEAGAALMKSWRQERLAYIRRNADELYTVEQCRDVIVDLLDLLMESS
jgi:hypothetical protein